MADKVKLETVNRGDLVSSIAQESGQSQSNVNSVLDAFFSTLAKNLGDNKKVSIPGWLAVEPSPRAARTGRNPQTNEPIEIAASTSIKISAGSKLKAAVKA